MPSAGTLLIWGSVALEDGNDSSTPVESRLRVDGAQAGVIQQSVVQVRTVVLIALLAIVRKLLILDVSQATTQLFALATAIIALGVVYWLVRDQDRSIAGEGFARQRNRTARVGREKASSSEK